MEPDETTRSRIRKQFLHEALVWRQLKHPNVLPLLGVSTDVFLPSESFCLISPWMSNGDIVAYLKKKPDHSVFLALSEIASGLYYLHSRDPPIIHGDIRGGNILVDDNSHCCLADFGLALVATESQPWSVASSTGNSGKGATRWMAPECLNPKPASLSNTSRDVYALGCTIVEILTQKMPFPEYKDLAVIFRVLEGERPPRPDSNWCTEILWSLTTRCWAQRSEDRPSIKEVYADLKDLDLNYLLTTYRNK
ncbi:kinase-like protein [Rhodocollybia butyracea]|uniref:Kinase-like protein n=1 Tax=Rhodocollybia butyracea TaxID=206335 RepID=A0A9P5U1Z9_9AGAR|nr:kinase-like protein [Rhodocollybia butyracea]